MRFKPRMLAIAFLTLFLSAAAGAGATGPVRIVGLGDSLMAGFQLGPHEGFNARLQQALTAAGLDVEVANAGVSGDTTADGLARLDWSVPDGTDLVILELGANDALRGISPDITRANLDAMIARLKQRGIAVLLAGMLAPPNMGPDYQAAFDPIYPELAEKHAVPLYPFFLDGVAATPGLLLEDGMHPNPQGVDRIVEGILPLVAETIATLERSSGVR